MKKLFSILAAVIIIAAASFSANAQAPSPAFKASVSELLTLTNTRQIVEETLTATYDQMGLKFTIPTAQVVSKMFDSIWDRALEDYAGIYSKYYTLEELQQLCAFYKSPLGQKVTKYTPDINRDSMAVMQKYQSDFTSIITKYLKK